jgi:hypothetical protein
MPSKSVPLRTKRLTRNPLYKLIRDKGWKVTAIAASIGYESLSSFYKVLRFESIPDAEKLDKIGLLFDPPLSRGDVYQIWSEGASK